MPTDELPDEEYVPRKYERFYHNGVIHAFVECDKQMLKTKIPKEAKWGTKDKVYDEKGDLVSFVEKTLDEFTLNFIVDKKEKNSIVSIAAMEAPNYRVLSVTEADIEEWEGYLTAHGYPVEIWLNVEERNALLETEDYKEVYD
jgi:hypothetical protein